MTDAMMSADTDHPVFSLDKGATLVQMPGGSLFVRLDLSGVSDNMAENRSVVFSPDLPEEGQAVLNKGRLDILFRDGRISTIARDIFAYLSGAVLPGPDDGTRAPRGIGELSSNTLWTTTLELASLADSVRGRGRCSQIRTGDSRQNGSVWLTSVSHFFNLDGDGLLHGYDYQANGLAMGTDWTADGRWTLGASFGWIAGKNKMSEGIGTTDQDVTSGALYAEALCFSTERNAMVVSAILGYASASCDGTLRSPDLAENSGKGSWNESSWMIDLRGDWIHAISERTRINIFAGLQYLDSSQDTFTLKGNRYSYDFRDASMSLLRARLGAGIGHVVSLSGKPLTLHAEASVLPDLTRDVPETRVSSNGAIPWIAKGSEPGKVALRLDTAVAYSLNESWSISARYRLESADKSLNQSAGVGACFTF